MEALYIQICKPGRQGCSGRLTDQRSRSAGGSQSRKQNCLGSLSFSFSVRLFFGSRRSRSLWRRACHLGGGQRTDCLAWGHSARSRGCGEFSGARSFVAVELGQISVFDSPPWACWTRRQGWVLRPTWTSLPAFCRCRSRASLGTHHGSCPSGPGIATGVACRSDWLGVSTRF